jgi:hypothetical protein
MSLSSIRANPWIEEPSKPIPSSKAPSSSDGDMAKLFGRPRMSVNHNLTNLTPFDSIASNTLSLLDDVTISFLPPQPRLLLGDLYLFETISQ